MFSDDDPLSLAFMDATLRTPTTESIAESVTPSRELTEELDAALERHARHARQLARNLLTLARRMDAIGANRAASRLLLWSTIAARHADRRHAEAPTADVTSPYVRSK